MHVQQPTFTILVAAVSIILALAIGSARGGFGWAAVGLMENAVQYCNDSATKQYFITSYQGFQCGSLGMRLYITIPICRLVYNAGRPHGKL